MSVNTPPNPNVSTFNNLYWIQGDIPLTTAEGDLRYLKFPVAQGTENLQAINVNGLANFLSTSPPTSSQTIPASNDSSTKIPTTAWVQSAITGGGGSLVVYNIYTSSQTITAPANTYKFDIMVFGSGGLGGTTNEFGSYLVYGGAGAGGNMATTTNISWKGAATMALVVQTGTIGGYTEITFGSIGSAKCFNGGDGSAGISAGTGAGGVANSTPNVLSTTIASWLSFYGANGSTGGSASFPSGYANPPTTVGGSITNTIYTAGSVGAGQSYSAKTLSNSDSWSASFVAGGCIITWYKTA